MAAIPIDWKRVGVNGELKKMVIKGTSATETGDTYNTNMDATDGRGADFEEIFDAYHVGETGTRVDASWDASTGIVTLGTVSGSPDVVYLVIEGY